MIVLPIDRLTCLTSEWFDFDHCQSLKDILRNGDLVQIKSKAISVKEDQCWEHWGVVIEYMHNDDLITTMKENLKGQPGDILIVHLNPGKNSSRRDGRNISIGKIDAEWKEKVIRRHNFRNLYWSPLTWAEMKERIEEEVRKNKCYCVLGNNCEMFSHRVRYGHSYSGQVEMFWKDVRRYSFFFFIPVSLLVKDFRYYLFWRCFLFMFSTFISGIRYG